MPGRRTFTGVAASRTRMAQDVAAVGVIIGAGAALVAGVAYIFQTVTRDQLSEYRRETAWVLGLWAVSLLLIFVSSVVGSRSVGFRGSEQQYVEALALAVALVTLQYLAVSITFEMRFDQWSDPVSVTLRKIVILSGVLSGFGAILFVNPPVTEQAGGAEIHGIAAICTSFLAALSFLSGTLRRKRSHRTHRLLRTRPSSNGKRSSASHKTMTVRHSLVLRSSQQ